MRAVECPCGEHIEAANDERLNAEVRRHAEEDHPGQYEDAELRRLVTTSAYDTGS